MASWWLAAVPSEGCSVDEYIERNYKRKSDKQIAVELSARLGIFIADEDVRRRRRYHRWRKDSGEVEAATPFVQPRDEGEQNGIREAVLKMLTERGCAVREISERLDRSEATVLKVLEGLRAEGYGIVIADERVGLAGKCEADAERPVRAELSADGWVTIGVISDTQFGNVWEQPTALATYLKWAYEEKGVRLIFHAGDVVDGVNMYKGHWLNLYARTFEEQAELVRQRLPQRDGLTYIMIGGQHDYSWYRNAGRHVLQVAAQGRPDLVWLGYTKASAQLEIGGWLYRVVLWHPRGGASYAKSYKLQRGGVPEILREFAKQNAGEQSERLLAVIAGHLHIRFVYSEGGVLMVQAGCFQDETQYIAELGLVPDVGGYVLRLHFDEKGVLDSTVEQWRAFQVVQDDWKNWPLPQVAEGRTERVVRLVHSAGNWQVSDGL